MKLSPLLRNMVAIMGQQSAKETSKCCRDGKVLNGVKEKKKRLKNIVSGPPGKGPVEI